MTAVNVKAATGSNRNRLAWQCRRGMRELDELLGGFLRSGYDRLDGPGRSQFSTLLEYPDHVLLEILMGRMEAADRDVAHIVRKIRSTVTP